MVNFSSEISMREYADFAKLYSSRRNSKNVVTFQLINPEKKMQISVKKVKS